mmetsp:Transcript_11040/g.19432  ORF Transcript_11040/g.19432 Transcript_11040/m.19432 type:complete len:491 (+) Transcript_11040:242-1714(+)
MNTTWTLTRIFFAMTAVATVADVILHQKFLEGLLEMEIFPVKENRDENLGDAPVSSATEYPKLPVQPLQFINNSDLIQHDYFSDSWLLSRERFLEMDTKRIGIVEDGVFAAVGIRPYDHCKMLSDWMAFSVEHMSHWWKLLNALSGDPGNVRQHIQSRFHQFVESVGTAMDREPPTALRQTIAMIAFYPYKAGSDDQFGTKSVGFTASSLAATIASLYRAGYGRVVIVGIRDDDMKHVLAACKILTSVLNGKRSTVGKSSRDSLLARLGKSNMEVAYVHVTDKSWIKTKWVGYNVPRAAIVGMQLALTGKMNQTDTDAWLGKDHDSSYWKYLYLTEPDTILQTKNELLPLFQQALDNGLSLFPHRLQPFPHEADLPADHTVRPGTVLPNVGHFAKITELDTSNGDSCCDGGAEWPGVKDFDSCGNWWYRCGYRHDIGLSSSSLNETYIMDAFKRLVPYPLMRLKDGTGFVFGSTEQGRRCFPSKNGCGGQ